MAVGHCLYYSEDLHQIIKPQNSRVKCCMIRKIFCLSIMKLRKINVDSVTVVQSLFYGKNSTHRCWGQCLQLLVGKESAWVCPDERVELVLPLKCRASAAGTGANECLPGQLEKHVWFSLIDDPLVICTLNPKSLLINAIWASILYDNQVKSQQHGVSKPSMWEVCLSTCKPSTSRLFHALFLQFASC